MGAISEERTNKIAIYGLGGLGGMHVVLRFDHW